MVDWDKDYNLAHEDCIEHMHKLPDACMDFAVFSPPFPTLYAYTNSTSDIGNSEDLRGDAKLHLSFFFKALARVVKPGRAVCVHVSQIPRLKRSGGVGLHDFRGLNIRLAERAGLVYEYDWSVRKNPQAQAIRTRSRELQFAGLENDRAKSRGAIPDYILKFCKPGENAVPGRGNDVSRNEWIQLAEHHWYDIKETDTLNVAEGRDSEDTKHICPLQLPVIRRLVKLFTNEGELVFSPVAGIGSEGYEALLQGRRFYGCEIKDSYIHTAGKNLERALAKRRKQFSLFADDDVKDIRKHCEMGGLAGPVALVKE